DRRTGARGARPRPAHDGGQARRAAAPPGAGGAPGQPGGAREAAGRRQADRPRAARAAARRGLVRRDRRADPAPRPRLRAGGQPADRRRRRDGLRHGRRPAGVRVQPGRDGVRRGARGGLRPEDRQGHGPRAQERLPRGRAQRGLRRPHPGGHRRPRALRRDLLPQHGRLRRRAADQPGARQLRGRPRLLTCAHRLHAHGRPGQRHDDHRTGRHQDGHGRGHLHRGPRRSADPQQHQRRGPLPEPRRGRRDRADQGAAVVPALEQPVVATGAARAGRPRRGAAARARHARARQQPRPVRHAHRHRGRAGRRGVPRGAGPVGAVDGVRLRPGRGPQRGRRRQRPDALRGHPGHRRLREGRALRPHLRRLQRPGGHPRRRAGLPAGSGAGARRHHPARRQAAVRLLRGDRPAHHGDHAQGVRRRVRRHGLQAPGGRRQPGLAHGAGRRRGGGRGREHRQAPRDRRRRGPRGDAQRADHRVRGHLRHAVRRRRARLRRRGDRALADPARDRPGAAPARRQAGEPAAEEAREHPPV
ncbi:MAG: Acetyl-coenzyme A carboxyl transferase alpha chain / Acetyl-coenzyme A carboxyl transferase beta chain; Propionyl-CoA carboxylase beta chain, partial [uncultured Frankineae bacterium]